MKGIRASKGLLFINILCLLWLPNYCDIKENAGDNQSIQSDKAASSDTNTIENVPAEQEKETVVGVLVKPEKLDVQSNVEYVNSVEIQESKSDVILESSLQQEGSLKENTNMHPSSTARIASTDEVSKPINNEIKEEGISQVASPHATASASSQVPVLPSLEAAPSPEPSSSLGRPERKKLVGPSLHSAAVEALARSASIRGEERLHRYSTEDGPHPHYDGMPSFDEWKKMMLAEQERGGQKVPSPSPPGKKLSGQKRRRNYSSFECGAKIVASNAEAEGTGRILNELVDEYMLNPCRAKIWFVIELCETVQATQIELANFELFSSCPKDFVVYSSDNFPTRDWVQLGAFSAAEQRVLQSFELKQEGFGKFIKVELLSYYGKEHYCPLSVVRIFGTSMVDEYEEMETLATHPEVSDDDLDRLDIVLEDKKPSNLFGSATDAVMNIVKKAAQALGQQQPLEDGKNDTYQEQKNSSASKECKAVDNSSEACERQDFSTLPNSMHLFRLLRRCDQCVSSRIRYYSSAQPHCRFFQAAFGPVAFQNICDWYRGNPLVFAHETPTHRKEDDSRRDSSAQTPTKSPPPQIIVLPPAERHGNATPPAEAGAESVAAINATRASAEERDDSAARENGHLLPDSSVEPTQPVVLYTVSVNATEDASGHQDRESPGFLSPDISIELPRTPVVTLLDDSNLSLVEGGAILEPPPPTEVSPLLDPDAAFDDEDAFLLDPTASEDPTTSAPTTEVPPARVAEDARGEAQGATASSASGSGQKESVFMRMSNRIKALEINMSLSGQYLQELSQRYRRQMEEMQRAFNRTIGTLNDTAKKAEEKDVKQQEILNTLQLQVSNLTETVEFLLNERSSVLRQIVETHVFLMLIEAIVMVTAMSLWVRRVSPAAAPAPAAGAALPAVSSPRLSKRRSSADSCVSPVARKVKRRSASEEILGSAEDELLIVEPSSVYIDHILKSKKKSRRRSKVHRSIFNPTVQRRNSIPTSQQPSVKRVSYSDGCTLKHSKINQQFHKKYQACENCNDNNSYIVKASDGERKTNGTPFLNLTNGAVSNFYYEDVKSSKFEKGKDKFSFKKFLRFQKRDSI